MDKVVYFWSGWDPILRILLVGTLTYLSIIIMLRVAGKRTLANMNAFDFIISVTLGSTFGRILTATSVSISEAFAAFLLLVVLQYLLSVVELRSPWFKRFVTSQPSLLYFKDRFNEKTLRKERMRKDDIISKVRQKGFKSMTEVEAVVLETTGDISVIRKSDSEREPTYDELL